MNSFNTSNVDDFKKLMGGESNINEITLQSFYSHWNSLNSTPILKQLKYYPLKYNLTESEMTEYNRLTRFIHIEQGQKYIKNDEGTAAIRRANWLRGLEGGINVLQTYLRSNLQILSKKSTIIFVQTNEIAKQLRDFITTLPGWDKQSSVYIYDSYQDEDHREIAMNQFKMKIGDCLLSEQMLSEGFNLPKLDMIILHGLILKIKIKGNKKQELYMYVLFKHVIEIMEKKKLV